MAEPAAAAPQATAAHAVGTIKSIDGTTIVLTTDEGTESTVQVVANARLVRIEPGAKDLKNAAPLQLTELQPGDRILVRGKTAIDGKTLEAISVIAMKHEDIAAKRAHEREEWQTHGVGGLVTAVDPGAGTIKISTNSMGAAKEVTVVATKQSVLRRYAPNSVKFDDAKPAPIGEIKVGDQLRARGTRTPDGAQLTADEIVSGTFRNLAGTVSGVDSAAGTLTVTDLMSKKEVTVKIGPETQMRKLPAPFAQRIAMRLKAAGGETGGANGSQGGQARPAAAAEARPGGENGERPGGQGGMGRAGGGADFQQMLSRMPAAKLTDLQKGDAVMIVTTEGTSDGGATAITLLAGVEPILEAAPKGGASSLLSPWTMSEAPSGDANP
ncbi:MAG TPA: DUF5666 domain-containing protein [Candidatus Acidoferrum sp.]|nr:DUF5666 domain-containing protein [Candidatus Acidoferrum sp.]